MIEPTLRVDLWLWAARFFKTRALAKAAIVGGKISVNGTGCKPAKTLHTGDSLSISRGEDCCDCVVTGLSSKRLSAALAQALYQETEESVAARAHKLEQNRLQRAGHSQPPGRPDKQQRRQLLKLKTEGMD